MIQRSPLKRRTVPMKAKRSQPRRGPMRDRGYMAWLKERWCVSCWRNGGPLNGHHAFSGVIDPAHTENNGMRSKGPDSSCAPLCRVHHREYDSGRAAFEAKYGIDMKNEAAAHWAAYQLRSRLR